jgi:hypothetical protein
MRGIPTRLLADPKAAGMPCGFCFIDSSGTKIQLFGRDPETSLCSISALFRAKDDFKQGLSRVGFYTA